MCLSGPLGVALDPAGALAKKANDATPLAPISGLASLGGTAQALKKMQAPPATMPAAAATPTYQQSAVLASDTVPGTARPTGSLF